MAFPALIQKIFDLRNRLCTIEKENENLCASVTALSEANIRLSTRLALDELAFIGSKSALPAAPASPALLLPEGHELACGARIVPVTLQEKDHPHHPGAALTVIIDELEN